MSDEYSYHDWQDELPKDHYKSGKPGCALWAVASLGVGVFFGALLAVGLL